MGFRETSALLLFFTGFLYNCFSLSPSVLASDWRCLFSSSVVKPFTVDISSCCCIQFSIGVLLIFRIYKRSITSVFMQRSSTIAVPTSLRSNVVTTMSFTYTADISEIHHRLRTHRALGEYIDEPKMIGLRFVFGIG